MFPRIKNRLLRRAAILGVVAIYFPVLALATVFDAVIEGSIAVKAYVTMTWDETRELVQDFFASVKEAWNR